MSTALRTVPVAGPWITEREVAYAADAAQHGWYERAGEYPARFEEAFAAAVGRRHAVSLPSGTSGLHLALAALGVGPGDEVVLPESTWIASAAPVAYVGATPVFADVDPGTWCLSVDSFEAAITERTRAVVPVDLYGGMPDLDALCAVAAHHGVAVVEDAAEAVGSAWHGRPAGSFGAASAFSFHGSKTLTTGEGGMVVTDDDALHGRMLVLRDHGRSPGDVSFRNREVAWKYKMSPVQAALGLAQVERLPELVGRKRDIFGWYRERLAGCPGVTALNAEPPGLHNSYWMTTLVLDAGAGVSSAALAGALAARGVATRPFFHPLSSLDAFAGAASAEGASDRNPVAHRLAPLALNLPSALCLGEDDVDYVCEAVRTALGA